MRGAACLFPRLFLQLFELPYGKSAPFARSINEQKKETVPLMSSPLYNWPPLFARGLFRGARGLLSLSRYFNQRAMCFCTIEVVSSGFIVDQPWFPSKRMGKLPSIIFITNSVKKMDSRWSERVFSPLHTLNWHWWGFAFELSHFLFIPWLTQRWRYVIMNYSIS